ncbi:MAG: hypothetical protein CM15mV103_290 [uncultured marine virus]|nr:MAG: hypothetical protein CM15mV103_290 [uncultured marine virus]
MEKKSVFGLKRLFLTRYTFIFQSCRYLWLRSEGSIKGPIMDTMIAASLIDENSFSLKNFSKHMLVLVKMKKF